MHLLALRSIVLYCAVLCALVASAQQQLSRNVRQLPPLADKELDSAFRHILKEMDRFAAESSMNAINSTFQRVDRVKDKEASCYLYCFRAEVLYYEGLFNEGIADLDNALQLAQDLQDSLLIANVYNLKGLLHENITDNRNALPWLRLALAWFPKHPAARYPVSELHHIHGNLGSYLTGIGQWDSAGVHLERSLEIAQEVGAGRAMAVAWWSLGNLAMAQHLADSALTCFDRSAEVAAAAKDHDVGLDALVGRAEALDELGRDAMTTAAMEQARAFLVEHEQNIGFVTQRNAYRRLANVWQHRGKYQQAVEHMAEWYHIDSAITSGNIRTALRMQEARLRADADLAMERVRSANSRATLEQMTLSRNLVIVASLVGTALLISLFLGLRARQRAHQRLAELEVMRLQQERVIAELRVREEVGRDMHDDMGAGLSALKLRSEMALRKEQDADRRSLLEFIASTAGELMVNMRQMIWTMNADQTSVADLLAYCGNYARTYLDAHGVALRLTAPEHVPPNELSAQQRRNLLLVVKEALHNVVKHARAQHVTMEVRTEEDALSVTITDDGTGVPRNAEKGEGNGLRNMARRMEMVGGTFHIDRLEPAHDRPETHGTRVHVRMPLNLPERT